MFCNINTDILGEYVINCDSLMHLKPIIPLFHLEI